jgi:hypothetical protein
MDDSIHSCVARLTGHPIVVVGSQGFGPGSSLSTEHLFFAVRRGPQHQGQQLATPPG